jgi:transposase-like protein
MGDALRQRCRGTRCRSGRSWYVDETYLKVQGRRCYLYRAIDRDGNLVDTMLSETRDLAAAKALFRLAKATTGFTPDRVTTDRARLLSKGSSLDPGPEGPAPDERLFEQSARTGSPQRQGAHPMYARL